jgi:hypothetical protein
VNLNYVPTANVPPVKVSTAVIVQSDLVHAIVNRFDTLVQTNVDGKTGSIGNVKMNSLLSSKGVYA